MLSEEIKQKLILAAIWAPSADNSQPFQYQWQDESMLSLFIDPERSGKASDNRFVLSDIALGAVIENVVIAAGASELKANVSYLPNANDEYHVCNISFDSTTELNDEDIALANFIEKRTTDRRFPFKGQIDEDTKAKLSTAGKCYGCQGQLYW